MKLINEMLNRLKLSSKSSKVQKAQKSKKARLTDMKLINEMINWLKLMSFAVVLVILHELWSFS